MFLKKFYIVNDFDRPYKRLLCVECDGLLYYLDESLRVQYKAGFNGFDMSNAAPIEDFGFDITEDGDNLVFTKNRKSEATYKTNGCWRDWQGEFKFSIKKCFLQKQTS